jgi:hypothetical protein
LFCIGVLQVHGDVTDQLKTPKCSCDGQEMARVLVYEKKFYANVEAVFLLVQGDKL